MRSASYGRSVLKALLSLSVFSLFFAHSAAAQKAQRVDMRLTVSHLSSEPGPIDDSAADLHNRLRRDFRYRSVRVLESKRMRLNVNEVGSMQLPTGRLVRVRLLDVGSQGVLIAVDIDQTLQTDLRVRNRQQVVIGAERYQDGKLILTLEPRYKEYKGR